MARTWRSYAPTERAARELNAALRAFLICAGCGSTEQCIPHMRSQSSVVMKCHACGLRYHIRREDLAASARRRAAEATDPKQAALYDRVAAVFTPFHNARHTPGALPPDPLVGGVPEVDVDA